MMWMEGNKLLLSSLLLSLPFLYFPCFHLFYSMWLQLSSSLFVCFFLSTPILACPLVSSPFSSLCIFSHLLSYPFSSLLVTHLAACPFFSPLYCSIVACSLFYSLQTLLFSSLPFSFISTSPLHSSAKLAVYKDFSALVIKPM